MKLSFSRRYQFINQTKSLLNVMHVFLGFKESEFHSPDAFIRFKQVFGIDGLVMQCAVHTVHIWAKLLAGVMLELCPGGVLE